MPIRNDIRSGDADTPKVELPARRRTIIVESISKPLERQSFAPVSAKPAPPALKKGRRLPASKSGHEEDRVALIRAPRAETNHGKDPKSRAYIRGILHTHPWYLRFGAVFSLLLIINLPAAVISTFLLLVSGEHPEVFGWVPGWLLVFPIALPLTSFGYLLWGMTGKCLVCKQRLFARKGALKHVNAHRIRRLGFIIPLCLHMLVFHWFRCSSCGTPVRLRK
ncbi:MAG: hypothetical protein RLZZ505_1134 [Verrucomicrobiota bacterium]|jgi:hypothetical protein